MNATDEVISKKESATSLNNNENKVTNNSPRMIALF
jgi:hypothetical protein